MRPWVRITLVGAVAVVAFDALASLASRASGVPYLWATIGSTILYAGFGYLAARTSPAAAVRSAALTGLALGLTDASIGWAISWILGPGRVGGGLTVTDWVAAAVTVVVIAVGVAALGGLAGRPERPSDQPAI